MFGKWELVFQTESLAVFSRAKTVFDEAGIAYKTSVTSSNFRLAVNTLGGARVRSSRFGEDPETYMIYVEKDNVQLARKWLADERV